MKYLLKLSDQTELDLAKLRKSGNKQVIKKLNALLDELRDHPETGTGKPERLKHEYAGKWSRHISDKHRLIYEIFEQIVTVEVLSAYSHYGDK